MLSAWSSHSLCAEEAVDKCTVVFASPEGHPLKATLFLPKAGEAPLRPAVVLVHGGAWLFGSRRQLDWYGRHLADVGYVALSVNYRMMPLHKFPACIEDCKTAVRWLRRHADDYRIDRDRIGVLGNSAGGHLAGLLATTAPADGLEGAEHTEFSSAVQSAVSLYGVADLSYYRAPSGWIRMFGFTRWFMRKFVGAEPIHGRDPYEAASPVTYASRSTCPLLLVHGTKDGQVPYAQSVAFCEQLRRLGVPARLITVRHGHAFDFFHPRVREHVFEPIRAFMDEHLKAAPPP